MERVAVPGTDPTLIAPNRSRCNQSKYFDCVHRLGASAILLFKMANQREDSMDVRVFFLCVLVSGQFKEEMVSGEGFSII